MKKLYYSSSYQSYYYPSTLNYVTEGLNDEKSPETPVNTVANSDIYTENFDQIYATYPLFFQSSTTINIPQNIKRHIFQCEKDLSFGILVESLF